MDWNDYDACLFDLDGVLTPTAEVHMRAWEVMFSDYLADYQPHQPPYTSRDYFAHVDGKPRYEGVRSFLASRGIHLPEGSPEDAGDELTVCGLGNRKNLVFSQLLRTEGVRPYAASVRMLDWVSRRDGMKLAVVSSSRNAPAVLRAAGLADRFPVVVDGAVAVEEGLPGKPAPDTFRYAAHQVGVPNQRAVVLEDALSGVRAGRSGDFGLVVGVDRGAGSAALTDAGADLVVKELDELIQGS